MEILYLFAWSQCKNHNADVLIYKPRLALLFLLPPFSQRNFSKLYRKLLSEVHFFKKGHSFRTIVAKIIIPSGEWDFYMYNELYWTLLRMNLKGVKLMIAKIIILSREWDFYMNVEMNLTLLRINLKGV